jgi:hypothetical protein
MRALLLTLILASGCAGSGPVLTQAAGEAIKALLPVAADALREAAAREGIEIDENGAACFEAPEMEVPQFEGIGVVAIVCVAPHIEE